MVGVREALKKRPGTHASVLLDTKGPEIRTGNMVDNKPIILERNQLLELSKDLLTKQLTTLTWEPTRELPARIKIWRDQ
jgi:pyruvate kinase